VLARAGAIDADTDAAGTVTISAGGTR
jgi:hypothetical protein